MHNSTCLKFHSTALCCWWKCVLHCRFCVWSLRQHFGYLDHQSGQQWADFSDWEGFTILDFGSGVVYPDLCLFRVKTERFQCPVYYHAFKIGDKVIYRAFYRTKCFSTLCLNIWWICTKFLRRSILQGCWSWPVALIWEVKDLLQRFGRWWMVLTGKKATP